MDIVSAVVKWCGLGWDVNFWSWVLHRIRHTVLPSCKGLFAHLATTTTTTTTTTTAASASAMPQVAGNQGTYSKGHDQGHEVPLLRC